MSFRIHGLSPEPFRSLFGASEQALAARGIVRMQVDECPGFPDRITLTDVPVGESVLLLNHVSLDVPTPYRATHAIFVWEGSRERYDEVDVVPAVLCRRTLSLRAFDADGMMRGADIVDGAEAGPAIEALFENGAVSRIHIHYAKPGCFAGEATRV